jgi:transposase
MKTVTFGKYTGRPLSELPVPYLLFIMTRIGIRSAHPDVIEAFMNELADRLVGDFDGTLAELLAPVPPMEIALAKLRKLQRAREKLAKLEAKRLAEHAARSAGVRARLAATPGGRALLARRGER